MSDELWIVIPRWNDFQHPDTTRSGVMPWVKNFTRLLSDDRYLDLSFVQRGILHSIWLEYARSRGKLRMSTDGTLVSLSRRLGQNVRLAQLVALNDAGFIEFSASSPASTRASKDASTSASNLASPEENRGEERRPEDQDPVTETVLQDQGGNGSGAWSTGEDLEPLVPATPDPDIPF